MKIEKRHNGKLTFILALCCFIFSIPPARAATARQISQYGVTWTFDKEVEYGQFVNGDYWVVGPVTIVSIDPPSVNANGKIINGSMVNPRAGGSQGFDSGAPDYSESLNIGNDLPVTLAVNSSLLSAISREGGINDLAHDWNISYLEAVAILTCLDSAPADGSFRPAYCGLDKTIPGKESDLDYTKLANLAPTTHAPSLSATAGYFERPWIDFVAGWTARYTHPHGSMPNYGADISTRIGYGLLALQLNNADAQKRDLMIGLTQLGIDNYGIIQNGGIHNWSNDGGHAGGRKITILFSGLVLNNSSMKAIGQKSGDYLTQNGYGPANIPPDYIHFGEEDQTFYVTALDVALTNGPTWNPTSRDTSKIPYSASDIGLPEWGIRHCDYPQYNNKWLPTDYRTTASSGFISFVLAAHIMPMKTLWNHNALFDYSDRYMMFTAPGGEYYPNGLRPEAFTQEMWDTYRAHYDSIWSQTVTYGDVSGDGQVTAYDAALTAQAAVGLILLTVDQSRAADISGDNEITAYDAALIAQYAVGLITKFPVEDKGFNNILVPGTGFTGPTPQPDPVGDSTASGYDAKAIARWDVVPYQTFDGNFNIGVVAFHINGIDRIEFSANGGPWLAVRQMTLNSQTNIVEYWATLDAAKFSADGPIEVRAVAYPKIGMPRVLQGPMPTSWASDNGEHSLRLYTNAKGTMRSEVFHVKPSTGNDANPGTVNQPFATLKYALGNVSDGATIILDEPGRYDGNLPTKTVHNTRWVTVRPAVGLLSEEVVIANTPSGIGQIHVNMLVDLVHFQGVSIDWYSIPQNGLWYNNGALWLDNSRLYTSVGGWTNEAAGNMYGGNMVYVTEAISEDTFQGFNGATLVRNSIVRQVSGDAYTNAKFVINSSVDNFRNMDNGVWHSDLYQSYGNFENIIVYGLHGNFSNAQGLFIHEPLIEGQSMHNCAFIDMDASYTGGGWSSQISGPLDHILIRNLQNFNHIWLLRTTSAIPWKALQAKNVVFDHVRFDSGFYNWWVAGQRAPGGVTFIDCTSF